MLRFRTAETERHSLRPQASGDSGLNRGLSAQLSVNIHRKPNLSETLRELCVFFRGIYTKRLPHCRLGANLAAAEVTPEIRNAVHRRVPLASRATFKLFVGVFNSGTLLCCTDCS